MKYTFQHYVDIQTSASSLTLFQINAGGEYTMNRCKHLLGAYKYVKLGRISVKLLPASTLPVDPLGLSYASDDPQTVDPRDQMNPGLVRITNGEDIFTGPFENLSDTAQEQMYINTMLDPRWSKFMLQSGFKRSAVPLYWTVGQLHQDVYPGYATNVPGINALGQVQTTSTVYPYLDGAAAPDVAEASLKFRLNREYSDPRGLFQTGHRGRLSWMPTDAFFKYPVGLLSNDMLYEEQAMFQPLPEVQVITVLLPKAHKTVYYYRMFITETVYFSGIKNTGVNEQGQEYRAIDNFVYVPPSQPLGPQTAHSNTNYIPYPKNTGQGDQ